VSGGLLIRDDDRRPSAGAGELPRAILGRGDRCVILDRAPELVPECGAHGGIGEQSETIHRAKG
jgi:hypothetical protein